MGHRGLCRAVRTLCDSAMMGTCHHASVQTHRIYNSKRDPDVAADWGTMTAMCHDQLISRRSCTVLAGALTTDTLGALGAGGAQGPLCAFLSVLL